ncbi:site-2 protease family protein, partial [Candidatus Micrarchaeota archaeon]|nr:site-2 protease family protein [Candidatus Micrarchaeota archaeon]
GGLSWIIAKKHVDAKKFITGMILLIILSGVIAPYAIPFLMITLKGADSGALSSGGTGSGGSVLDFIGPVILLLGGMASLIVYNLVSYAFFIVTKLFEMLLGISTVAPSDAGATLILPGINIPLWEGILALVVILAVHEGAHAVLSRIAKIPLLSSGVVLFGIIPVGAFVEPDEKKLERCEDKKQTRVLVAGSTANFMTSIIFFLLFLSAVFLFQGYQEHGLYIIGGMETGTIIYTINGGEYYEGMSFQPNSSVVMETNKGTVIRETDENGYLGIRFFVLDGKSYVTKYTSGWMNFIYVFFGLAFSLNFVVGAINLLPIPAFDGYKLIEVNIKNGNIVKVLMVLSTAGLLINLVPLLF